MEEDKILGKLSSKTLILIILLVGFLAFAPILRNGFVWDDEEQIVNNHYIKNISYLPQVLKGSTFHSGGAGLSGWYYKPIMSLWFMVNYWLWGLNPAGFHFSQLLLHLVNGILVFKLFQRILAGFGEENKQKIAFWLALIFTIHPANVESVAYISASQEILYTFFLLLSFLTLLAHLSLLVPLALFFLSLLSKESAIVGLLILPSYFWLVKADQKKAIKIFFGFFLIFLFYAYLRTFVAHVPFSKPELSPIARATFLERLLTIPFILASYLRLIFFPLSLFIAQHQVVRNIGEIRFLVAFPIVMIFFSGLFWKLKRFSHTASDDQAKLGEFFGVWLVVSLGLVLNLFPLDMTLAERWLYWPILGILGMLGLLIAKRKKKKKKEKGKKFRKSGCRF